MLDSFRLILKTYFVWHQKLFVTHLHPNTLKGGLNFLKPLHWKVKFQNCIHWNSFLLKKSGLSTEQKTHSACDVAQLIRRSEEAMKRRPLERTDRVFKSVTWRQRVVSFSALLTLLRGDGMLWYMQHTQLLTADPCCSSVQSNTCSVHTHTHRGAHCGYAVPLWPLAPCIQAVGVQQNQLMVICWPGHQMDPHQVPVHATRLSTREQATCFSKQTHSVFVSTYRFGYFSCCGRNLRLHLQHRSRISTDTKTRNTWTSFEYKNSYYYILHWTCARPTPNFPPVGI